MTRLHVTGALFCIGLVATLFACSSEPAVSPEARAKALQVQVDDLNRQLAVVHSSTGAAQLSAMHDYWDMLQRQLRYVRNLPGVETRDCRDWALTDPRASGRVPTFGGQPCPALHESGPASGWPFPDQLNPELFQLTMRQHLDILEAQVAAIGAEADRNNRTDLIRQHYETRYRDIQTILGRSWMWTPLDPAKLPDAGSMGAQLFSRYCSQCHAPPPPALRTRAEWSSITRRMHGIIQGESAQTVGGVKMPTADEFELIASYLQAHGAP